MKSRAFSKIARFIGTKSWIRLGIRYWFWNKLKNGRFKVPFFGLVYSGYLEDYIDRHVFLFGCYEHDEIIFLKQFLNKDKSVLDVGCNTGHHSLFFSRFSKEVHAFDPYTEVTNVFRGRIKENNVSNIFIHEVGLGEKNTELKYFQPKGENQGAGSFIENQANISNDTKILPIRNGDTYVKNISVGKISLIKVDVEGYEPEVLRGLKQAIETNRPVVFVEFNKVNERFGGEAKIFQDLPQNYRAYMIQTNKPVLFLFNNPKIKLVSFDYSNPKGENIIFIPEELKIKI